jgi:hypothetical protein
MNKAIMKADVAIIILIINPFTHVTNSKHLLTAYQTISDSRRCAALAWLVKSRSLQQLVLPYPCDFSYNIHLLRQQKLAEEWIIMSPKIRAEMIPY